MSRTRLGFSIRTAAAVVTAVLFCVWSAPASASSPARQAEEFADLMDETAAGHLAPCIGTTEELLRSLVVGKIVSDEIEHYTSFSAAYPGSSHLLRGAIAWDLVGHRISGMMIILTDFHAPPAVLIAELQRARFECEEFRTSDVGTAEWECERDVDDEHYLSLDLYIGPGIMIAEVY
jgi:hypothetical protein